MINPIVRRLLLVLCSFALFASVISASSAAGKKRVLVISVTMGFRHGSIALGEKIIQDLGDKSGLWTTDFARDDVELVQKTSPMNLKNYDCVVFNNTTGDLPIRDLPAFLAWVKAGGAVYGIHAATDTYHGSREFIDMMGGEFAGHGPEKEVEFQILDSKNPATKGLPKTFKAAEEIYDFNKILNNYSDKVRVIMALDKNGSTGEPGFYPIAWVRNYCKGRVFYTAIGHREDIMLSDFAQKHYLGGMKWALGLAKGDATPLPPPAWVTSEEKKQGFRALPNSADLKGWHVREEGRDPWSVQNGWLVMAKQGAYLISDEKFKDFTIRYEYMLPKNGNSGVFLRGRYEIQTRDDFESKALNTDSNGAIYSKIAPSRLATLAPGQWQTVEATLIGNKVTVILNGVKIIDNQVLDGPTAAALDDNVNEPGPIMLQGDHGKVAFRNIRIKELK